MELLVIAGPVILIGYCYLSDRRYWRKLSDKELVWLNPEQAKWVRE